MRLDPKGEAESLSGVGDDEELADRWEAVLGRAVTHDEHLRIARVLVLRHGREEARQRLLAGTFRNCFAMGAEERFDQTLTERWAERVADCVEAGAAATFEDFIAVHSELRRSDLLGAPAWKWSASN